MITSRGKLVTFTLEGVFLLYKTVYGIKRKSLVMKSSAKFNPTFALQCHCMMSKDRARLAPLPSPASHPPHNVRHL